MISVNKRKIGVSIILSILTFGIYQIYWMHLLVKNTRIAKGEDTRCVKELLCVLFVPFYSTYWWITRGKVVEERLKERGYTSIGNKYIYFMLAVLGLDIVAMAVMQEDFNSLSAMALPHKKIDVVNLCIHVFFVVICLAIVYPFVSMLSVSLLSERELLVNGYSIWPNKPTVEAYQMVLADFMPIAKALATSLIVCVLSTLLTVILNAMYAYAVSRPTFPARRIINFVLLFTMFFGGGATASYIVNVKWLGLYENPIILIVPGTMGAMTVIIIRSFFQGLPYGLVESAKLDGASEYQTFFKIMMPLSTPALGTIAISAFIGSWNAYYAPMMYFSGDKYMTLSLYLQRTLDQMEQYKNSATLAGAWDNVPSVSAAMAVACITVLPMVMIFPWFQKYFVKGMAIGAVKA